MDIQGRRKRRKNINKLQIQIQNAKWKNIVHVITYTIYVDVCVDTAIL